MNYAKDLVLLYVEDNLDAQIMMQTILQEYFKKVVVASDGLEGIEAFRRHHIDMVITDISMPKLDGFAMIEEIKKLREDTTVLIFSAYSSTEFLHHSISLGVDGYLFKPFDIKQFEQVFFKAVKQIKAQRENEEYRVELEKALEERIQLLEKKEIQLKEKTKLAYRDQLTSLYNRYGLHGWFMHLLSRPNGDKSVLSLIVIDIDNFKKINDVYGHHIGDKVLMKIGKILVEQTEKTDIVARWGGEEFVVLLPNSDEDTAYGTAEQIRRSIESYYFAPLSGVTVSLGVATYNQGESLEAFIRRGDQAMYRAKTEGKNRTVCFSAGQR